MPSSNPSRFRKPLLWLLAIVLVAVVGLGLRSMLHEDVVVRTAVAGNSDLVSTISTNGRVEPVANFEAHSPYPATIKQVYVHQGDKVAAGQLLLAMDDADARARLTAALTGLRNAQLALDNVEHNGNQEERFSLTNQMAGAQMQRDQAARDLATLTQLQAKGAASAIEVANAQQRLNEEDNSLQLLKERKAGRFSSADLARANAQVADAQANYALQQSVLAQAIVRAPFAGTVYSLPVRKSFFVNGGETLLQMADLSRIRVRAYFDEPELGKLAVGQPVRITWDARPGASWSGHIERLPSTVIAYGTRNVGEVLAQVDDTDGVLLPNINVNVAVTILDKPNVLSVPREALRTDGATNYVFRIVDGKTVRTVVKVGNLNLTKVEIISGVKQGDAVALGSVSGQPLANGMAVRVAQ